MDRKLSAFVALFLVGFVVFVSFVVFTKQIARFSRADTNQPSPTQSLMFAWPLKAQSGGGQEVKIDVFVRTQGNSPIVGRTVNLMTTFGKVKDVSSLTDKAGQASFMISADTPGRADVTATIDNSIQVGQKLSIEFQ